jgi:hypothetical protein
MPETGASRKPGILSSLPGRLLLGVCILQFVLLAKLGWGFWRPGKPLLPTISRTSTGNDAGQPIYRSRPGPWGELEYARINLEPPDEFVPMEDGGEFEKARWFFEGHTRAQLTNLFTQSGLSAPQRAALLNPAAWLEETNGITVVPGDEIVLGLSRQARTQIYSVLGESTRNSPQCWPFRFRRGGFDDWFDQSGFSESTLTLVKGLIYERGATWCFSDVMEALSKIPSASERRQLVKTLAANSSLLMKLRIRPDSDVRALTAYWGRGLHVKDLEPLFRSLTKVRGGITIDVAQLLPPMARKRLNSYPIPSDAPSANPLPNCFWTAMNFFNEPPDNRYCDPEVWKQELETNYGLVTEPALGDLLFVVQPDGRPIHAAVFIADDVVFTKNGESNQKPWLLMKWEDVMASYATDHPVQVLMFRSTKQPN